MPCQLIYSQTKTTETKTYELWIVCVNCAVKEALPAVWTISACLCNVCWIWKISCGPYGRLTFDPVEKREKPGRRWPGKPSSYVIQDTVTAAPSTRLCGTVVLQVSYSHLIWPMGHFMLNVHMEPYWPNPVEPWNLNLNLSANSQPWDLQLAV